MQKNGLYWITGIAILLCMACAAVQAADINYELVTIKEIMDGNSLSSGRAVQIEGTIEKECPARGCWRGTPRRSRWDTPRRPTPPWPW